MMIPIAKPYLTTEDAQAAYDTILTGWITQGPRVLEFEQKFAAYTGSKYAVAVSNCTTALHLAFIVAGIKAGDEVICPSMSYIASANSITYVGATPVFAEIDPHNYNLDIADVEQRITNKTKAILLVHQIGIPADVEAWERLCKKYNLLLIEDAACAAGVSVNGKKIGADSLLACFSFHPRKVISTGDGGMITTNNEAFYNRMRLLRQHGMSVNDRVRHESKTLIFEDHVEIGYNYRMTDIQAAVGIKQLEKLDWIVAERNKIATVYNDALSKIAWIQLPSIPENCVYNYQSYYINLTNDAPIGRNELMQLMMDAGISTRRGIMCAHRETAYKHLNISLPASEKAADQSLCLPLYIPMDMNDVNIVIDFLKSIAS
ncbi:MAG: DegT/DnrJ/EryC1/StrS family aminotransferase [Bacteroidetes bacterium]|nr:DegT/DnrJ/EryC1/StrS family aminotransferase [Bacteroidota bacterium]